MISEMLIVSGFLAVSESPCFQSNSSEDGSESSLFIYSIDQELVTLQTKLLKG